MNLYIVSWGGEARVMAALSMDELWQRIRKNYPKGCVVTIEDVDSKKVYVR